MKEENYKNKWFQTHYVCKAICYTNFLHRYNTQLNKPCNNFPLIHNVITVIKNLLNAVKKTIINYFKIRTFRFVEHGNFKSKMLPHSMDFRISHRCQVRKIIEAKRTRTFC